jgi:membrane-bound metal-dependent hydrolase YbcI (DUF457 family)
MWRGHSLSGALVVGAAGPAIPGPLAPTLAIGVGAAIGALGALVPDLDHRDGKLTHSLGPVTWLASRALIALAKLAFRLTRGPRDFKDTNGHRGLTHAPLFQAVLAAGAFAGLQACIATGLAVFVAVALFLGQLTHSLGDGCTEYGVPLLWPVRINGRSWCRLFVLPLPLRFKTGGVAERYVTVVLAGLVGVLALLTLRGDYPL